MSHGAATYLPRLGAGEYRANAVVHWVLTTRERTQGWLTEAFHAQFRELIFHVCARQRLLCPAYCLMPDHMHLIWMGLQEESDQLKAMSFFRTYLNKMLEPIELNHQPYDHVLKPEERQKNAFARMCAYILENPVRAELVRERADWPYSGALLPGYPEFDPLQDGSWPVFWRVYFKLKSSGPTGQ